MSVENLNTLPNDLSNKASDLANGLVGTLEDTAARMRTLKDELAVRLNLAGKEVQDLRDDVLQSIDQLGNKLTHLAGSFDEKLESSQVQVHLGMMDAKERWDITREEAQKILNSLAGGNGKVVQLAQEVKLKARLAQLETKDFLSESKEGLSKNLQELSQQTSQALGRMSSSVSEFIHNLV